MATASSSVASIAAAARQPSRSGATRRRRRVNWVLVLRYAALLCCAVVALLPIYAALVASLTRFEHIGDRFIFPVDWAWTNYIEVWGVVPLAQFLQATLIYSLTAAVGCLLIATPAAYALSRMRFRGRRLMLQSLLLTQVIPFIVVAVPLFYIVLSLGLYDTYVAIGLAAAGVTLPFPIMFLKSYFDGIPRDMEEAAYLDGCGTLQALVLIVLPAARPALFTAFSLVFFSAWEMFLLPLVLANSADKTPVTVGIFRMVSDSVEPWQYIMAASIIGVLPPVLLFMLAQKHLIGGLTAGAVK